MKVYCFGCSWTYGQKDDKPSEFNWVNSLAKKYPQYQFENYSLPGSSLLFSVAQLNWVLKWQRPGIRIFQITHPFRYTSWDQNYIDSNKVKNELGVLHYSQKALNSVERYFASWRDDSVKENKQFFDLYYKKHTDEAEKTQFIALNEYVKNHSHFCFYQRRHGFISNPNIPCIHDILGDEKTKSFEHDGGFHFGEEGSEWVANWISNNIGEMFNASS